MAAIDSSRAARRAERAREPERRSRLALVNARALPVGLQRRRARLIGLLAAALVVGALFLIVSAQALIASQQVRLDNLQGELATATASNDNLQLHRAELAAPAQVLALAERHLHMVPPAQVTYLSPIDPGPSVSQAAAAASR